ATARVEEHSRPWPADRRRPSRESGPGAHEVRVERAGGIAAERDDPVLAALAVQADETLAPVHVIQVEPDGLADPRAAAVQELEEGSVTQPCQAAVQAGRLQEPLDV